LATHSAPSAAAPGFSSHGQPLATHRTALTQPAFSAPRPYLHPVLSLEGVSVTEAAPPDHPHHLGLSVAFSDVNGTNFWGGSTYLAGRGPTLLANHGTQVPRGWEPTPAGESGEVSWQSGTGGEVAVEKRRIQYFGHPAPGSWSLSWSSVIRPAPGVERLSVSSSAVKGRAGAGYGGIFWRFPRGAGEPVLLSDAGPGADAAHGSLSPWLSVTFKAGSGPVTVLLAQDPECVLPWFVRADGYLGAGPAAAWAEPVHADRAHPLRLGLDAVIHDGPAPTPARARELLQQHPRTSFPSTSDRTS